MGFPWAYISGKSLMPMLQLLHMYSSIIYMYVHTSVTVEPTVILPNNNSVVTINETDSYSITCNATGIPAPMTFMWLKDGVVQNYTVGTDSISVSEPSAAVPYSTSDGDILSVSQDLTISSAMHEDSGTYTCVASNGIGNDANVVIQLVVQG